VLNVTVTVTVGVTVGRHSVGLFRTLFDLFRTFLSLYLNLSKTVLQLFLIPKKLNTQICASLSFLK
jgi:hypothetical protein